MEVCLKITCNTLADFLTNLRESKFSVFRNTVYVDRNSVPLNGTSKRDATSFEIFLKASAVLEFGDEGQALLQYGESCGIDRMTVDGEAEGSQRRSSWCDQLTQYCEENNLKILPGIIDE